MDLENYSGITMDFQKLISCIECHEDSSNIPVILETLKTIVDICKNEECGKDAFREEGGIDFLLDLLSSTDSTILLEHTLKTLALVIDENVHSQMHMTKKEFFEVLLVIIRRKTFPSTVLKNTLLLASSILYQNSKAQILISEVGFLDELINTFVNAAPSYWNSSCAKTTLSNQSVDIWMSANSALCFSVNNPQNERNQNACSVLFPMSLKLLECSCDYLISSAVSSFLSLCISNNAKNQECFAEHDGLIVLKRCLQKCLESVMLHVEEFKGVGSKHSLQSLSNLIGIISAVANENAKNSASLGNLGMLSMVIKLLDMQVPSQLQIKIILTLAYCIDAHRNCKSFVLQCSSFDNILKRNFQSEDVELISASKYLLQVCVAEEASNPNIFSDDNSVIFPSVSDKLSNDSNEESFSQKVIEKDFGRENHFNQFSFLTSHQNVTQKTSPDVDSFWKKDESGENERHRNKKGSPYNNSERFEFYNQYNQSERNSKRLDTNSLKHSKYLSQSSTSNCTCSGKVYKNSKKENVLLFKNPLPTSSKSHRKRTNDNVSQTVNNTFSFESQQKKALRSNKNVTLDSFENFVKQFNLPPKKFKSDSTSRSLVSLRESFDQYKEISSTVFAEQTNLMNPSSKTSFGNKDFMLNPFLISISDELKENPVSSHLNGKDSEKNIFRRPNSQDKISVYESNSFVNLKSSIFSKINETVKNDKIVDKALDFNHVSTCRNDSFKQPTVIGLFRPLNSRNSIIEYDKASCRSKKKTRNTNLKKHHRKEKLEASETNSMLDSDLENYMQIMVFPGDICEQHRLIANSEMLKVVPLDEKSIQ